MVKANISDYDTTAGNNTDVNGVDIAEGCLPGNVNNAIREVMAALARMNAGTETLTAVTATTGTIDVINTAQGANIASASTINLETATGQYVHITGTTAITAITLSQGHWRVCVFDGALTLTNGASLILPGGANITTAAGDIAAFWGEAAGVVRCSYYTVAADAPGGGGGGGGDITGVTAGTGLSGGGTSGDVTLNLANTAVTAATYGDANNIPQITIDAQGRITAAADVPIVTAGKVAQVATTTWSTYTNFTDTIPFDNTTPQNTEGAERFTLAITPTNASSVLIVEAIIPVSVFVELTSSKNRVRVVAALFRDSTAGALATNFVEIGSAQAFYTTENAGACNLILRAIVSASAASATTFKVRTGVSHTDADAFVAVHNGSAQAGAARFNSTLFASMTITEIMP